MVELAELWLPILLSAVAVFIISSVLHMCLPVHKGDYRKLPKEGPVMDVLRGTPRGEYMFPCPGSMKDMASPDMLEKYNQGPVGYLSVVADGPPPIGKSLIQWFIYSIVVALFVGYAAAITLDRGAADMDVFRVTGTIGILGFALGSVPNSIWKGVSWTITAKFIFDGVLYGLATAGIFCWLWPSIA